MCTIDGKTNEYNYYSSGVLPSWRRNWRRVCQHEQTPCSKQQACYATNDKDKWLEAIEDEYQKMVDYTLFEAVDPGNVPPNAKILTSTWAMKKKVSGKNRARINARGCEQIHGIHYDDSTKSTPVTNDITICIIFVLMVLAGWTGHLVDVRGAFLNGLFRSEERLYMRVPEGFEPQYPNDRLTIWLSWVDNCLGVGRVEDVLESKELLKSYFECDDIGPVNEYVGYKVTDDRKNKLMRFTQPVLLQLFRDEFSISSNSAIETPATPGEILVPGDPDNHINPARMKKYRSGVVKLLYLARWSRPDILNSVRELSRFMMPAVEAHYKAMVRVMEYCVNTGDTGLTLQPDAEWDSTKNFKFRIHRMSDSDYAKETETRQSLTGYARFLNGAPVSTKSRTQDCVTLSVTEAELVAATHCVQDMLYIKKIVESMELTVELPLILYVDNKGAKDITDTWTVNDRTRHVDVRYFSLRELKEAGIVRVEWISTTENSIDIFTKNCPIGLFSKLIQAFCGKTNVLPGKGVGRKDREMSCIASFETLDLANGYDAVDQWTNQEL